MLNLKRSNQIILISLILISIFLTIISANESFAFDFELDFIEIEGVGNIEKKGDESKSTLFANLCLLTFIIANIYVLSRIIIEKTSPGIRYSELQARLDNFMSLHIALNIFAFAFTLAHAHYASATNVLFVLSEIILVVLIFGGIALRYSVNIEIAKLKKILSVKKLLFVALTLCIVLGHMSVDA